VCHDPLERDDRLAAEPERVLRMKALLEAEKRRSRGAQLQADDLVTRPVLSPEALHQLQGLGYGGGEPEPGKKPAPAGSVQK
jgi:hypothetical protein